MASKRDLGVGYLLAVGTATFALLASGVAVPGGRGGPLTDSASMLAILTGSVVATGFTATGVALGRSELNDERVWRIAQWSTLGLAVPTLASIGVAIAKPGSLSGLGWRSVIMMNIASGGIIAILVGSLVELRAEHARTKRLNQRNTVFLRLLRHDIRTSANLIQGHAERLAGGTPGDDNSLAVVTEQVDRIVGLSEAARELDRLKRTDGTRPVDLSTLVERRLASFETEHPEADVTAHVDPGVWVCANGILSSVVDNILGNAAVHGGRAPRLDVAVRRSSVDGFAEFRVEDDGPGFSEVELAVHRQETETALRHSDGVSLWLAQWVLDSCDGELSLANADDGGAVVTVRLPLAESEATSQERSIRALLGGT
jgi:signal transduction histidine kinase